MSISSRNNIKENTRERVSSYRRVRESEFVLTDGFSFVSPLFVCMGFCIIMVLYVRVLRGWSAYKTGMAVAAVQHPRDNFTRAKGKQTRNERRILIIGKDLIFRNVCVLLCRSENRFKNVPRKPGEISNNWAKWHFHQYSLQRKRIWYYNWQFFITLNSDETL